jgi:hypothetical protein
MKNLIRAAKVQRFEGELLRYLQHEMEAVVNLGYTDYLLFYNFPGIQTGTLA